MVTLKQLEALYWIGQLGTFERAAARLNTTQSAISKRVQELELETRVPLFDRSQRGARMTEKGERLLAMAEEMLTLQRRVAALDEDDATPARRLRLGITELTALTWLPRLITELLGAYPNLSIEAEVDMGRSLHDRLLEDRLDVIVVPETFSDPHVGTLHLGRIRNVWMASPKLVGDSRTLSLDELAEFTILMQGNRSGSGLWVSRWFKSEGAMVRRNVSSESLIALLGMAVAGLGVTYLPLPCFAPLVAEGKLAVIPTDPELPAIPYAAMFRSDRPHAFTQRVAEIARAACDFTRQLQI